MRMAELLAGGRPAAGRLQPGDLLPARSRAAAHASEGPGRELRRLHRGRSPHLLDGDGPRQAGSGAHRGEEPRARDWTTPRFVRPHSGSSTRPSAARASAAWRFRRSSSTKTIADELVATIVELARDRKIGPAYDETTEMGPLVNAEHMAFVNDWIEKSVEEGAVPVLDGRDLKVEGHEERVLRRPDGVRPRDAGDVVRQPGGLRTGALRQAGRQTSTRAWS